LLANRVIPSLLVRGQRLVKGVTYADWRDAGNPQTTVRAYNAQKADEIILMDIDASQEQRGPDLDIVRAVASECEMPLTVGGGIKTPDAAAACLSAGADKIAVTSAAFEVSGLIEEMAHRFGAQAVVVGLDIIADGENEALYDHCTRSSRKADWVALARTMVARGAGEFRLMSVDREGTRCGLNVDLYRRLRAAVDVPIILEGGAGTLDHLLEAMNEGVDSVAIGTMLVFSDNNLVQVKRHLRNAGHDIRL
jgi:imidazole glycerol-phosphate synthase subunit HisF